MIKLDIWDFNINFNQYRSKENYPEFHWMPFTAGKGLCRSGAFMNTFLEGIDEEIMRKILHCFSSLDNNFNGKNGKEYLWEKVKNTCYSSNADYLIDEILSDFKIKRKYYTDRQKEQILYRFFSTWFNHDKSYLNYSVIENEIYDTYSITVSVCYDDDKEVEE